MKRASLMISRLVGTALLVCLALAGAGLQAREKLPKAQYKVRAEKNVMVPMGDGKKLATDIYFPVGLDQAPVILIRTCYGKSLQLVTGRSNTSKIFASRGYIVMIQDVRGRYGSEGDFYPFISDGQDGQDTIAWIQKQPWFSGKLGTYGGSYLGTTQWFEAPGQDIAAMHLMITSPNLKEIVYTGGELHLMTVYFWAMATGERKDNFQAVFNMARINKSISTLPLAKADDRGGRDVKYFDDSLDPATIIGLYEKVSLENKYGEISAPAVFVAGWYDMFLGPQLKDFERLLMEGKGSARDSLLIVGPWGHGMNGGDKSVSYGRTNSVLRAITPADTLAWFDHQLKGKDNQAAKWPRVKIFVMGDNLWRNENEWPLARARYTNYYFHSAGKANTRLGDGGLSMDAPGSEPADKFSYDPLHPVPSKGGNSLGLNLGAYDQSEIELRNDVLCYQSAVLEKELEVTGSIRAVLYAASDAKDTDFTVKLVDVYPDGKAVNIQDGIVRAMYRNNDPRKPTPLAPGAVEKYDIDLWASSNVFKAGHRLRVEVSSSNFPRFNRNLNTGEPVPEATRTVVASQLIYHDAGHPSRIILPVIPR